MVRFFSSFHHQWTRISTNERQLGLMVTENPVTPRKYSNYINYQRFMSVVFPGAYIRVGGWGTNLTTGTHQWYARALIVCASNIFAELYILRARFLPLSLRYLKRGPRSKAYSTSYPKTIFVFIGVHSWFAFLFTTNGREIRGKPASLPSIPSIPSIHSFRVHWCSFVVRFFF